jgi:hypothetical protein
MAKHKQEDPWAGFVDVLSSILMVVIFLVVILGVAIFGISQQITKIAVENAVKAERDKQTQAPAEASPPPPAAEQDDKPNPPVAMLKDEMRKPAAAEGAEEQKPPLPSSDLRAPDDKSMPPSERRVAEDPDPARGMPAKQNDVTEGKSNLAVRSIAAAATRTIDVASEEIQKSEDPRAEIVKTSHAIFALKFKTGSYRIDPSSAQAMCSHMDENMLRSPLTLEIRSIARTQNDSVSDARRVAYYRGMQTRTELIKCGIAEARISVKLREAGQGEDGDNVQVFVKP